MKAVVRVMKALSDPNRLKILKMLEARNLCVCEITAILGLAQSTVSKHLKILEDAELVESWREGAWMNYRLPDNDRSSGHAAAMLGQVAQWLNDDPAIREVLNRLPHIDRMQITCANTPNK